VNCYSDGAGKRKVAIEGFQQRKRVFGDPRKFRLNVYMFTSEYVHLSEDGIEVAWPQTMYMITSDQVHRSEECVAPNILTAVSSISAESFDKSLPEAR